MAGEGLIGINASVISGTSTIGAITSWNPKTEAEVAYATASDNTKNGSLAAVQPKTMSCDFTITDGSTQPAAGDEITIDGVAYHIQSTDEKQSAGEGRTFSITGTEVKGQPA